MTSIKINTPADSWEYKTDYIPYATYYLSNAFDENETTYYRSSDYTVDKYIRFESSEPVIVDKVRIKAVVGYGASSIEIYGSDDPESGVSATLITTISPINTADWQDFTFSNTTKYRFYWYKFRSFYGSGLRFYELELWGPVAPGNSLSGLTKINALTDTYTTTFAEYYAIENAFDEDVGTASQLYASGIPGDIKLQLSESKICNAIRFVLSSTDLTRAIKDFVFYGSNNDIDWDIILSGKGSDSELWQSFEFDNSNSYLYYKILVNSNWGNINWVQLNEIELYGSTETTIHRSWCFMGFRLGI